MPIPASIFFWRTQQMVSCMISCKGVKTKHGDCGEDQGNKPTVHAVNCIVAICDDE
jgi:hypothetical protein